MLYQNLLKIYLKMYYNRELLCLMHYVYFYEELGETLISSIQEWTIEEVVEKLLGEQVSSIFDTFNIFDAIDQNFSYNNTVEYSLLATFIDFDTYLIVVSSLLFSIVIEVSSD